MRPSLSPCGPTPTPTQECSLDMEVYPRPELEARFHAIWRQVAVHFSEYPDDLCFEILVRVWR